jgi:hypothetical protein
MHRIDEKCVKTFLVGKPEGKRQHGRYRHTWEDSIRIDPSEIQWEGVDQIHLAQDRNRWWTLENTVTILQHGIS